jgi:hypothetical protein
MSLSKEDMTNGKARARTPKVGLKKARARKF